MDNYEETREAIKELEERVELEEITLQVLSDEIARIAKDIENIARQVREL
jgi:hypothetical protein